MEQRRPVAPEKRVSGAIQIRVVVGPPLPRESALGSGSPNDPTVWPACPLPCRSQRHSGDVV